MNITIKEKEYRFKMTWGALYAFEQYPFAAETVAGMGDVYKGLCLSFCILNAANTSFMEFEPFMEIMDDDKELALDVVKKAADLLDAWGKDLQQAQKKREEKEKEEKTNS